MIVDATGKLHDITKGAFDTFGMTHEGLFDPDFAGLMKGSFNDGVKKILSKAGLAGKALESWGESGWMQTVKQIVSNIGTESLAGELVAAGVGGAIGGPMGSAIGIAIEVGGVVAKSVWEIYKREMHFSNVSYAPGQWVGIDNGEVPAITNIHNVLENLWKRRLMGMGLSSDRPQIEQGEGVAFKESLSTGFIIGEGQENGTVQVFNFLSGREETKNHTEITDLDKGHAAQMDSDPIWSEIRLLHFEEREQSRLEGTLNTDPGSEVFFHGEAYMVVKSNGEQMLVENKQTCVQHWATADELIPGRRVHNNSWNYQDGGKVAGGFGGSEATLVQGGYIWIPPEVHIVEKHPSVKRQLACIYELHGHIVKAFAAIDGAPVRIPDDDPGLRPVSDELNGFLNQSREFTPFKDACVRGQDVARLAAGKNADVTLLCLGITPLDQNTEARPDWREKARTALGEQKQKRRADLEKHRVACVGKNQSLVDIHDTADEARELGGEAQDVVFDDMISIHSDTFKGQTEKEASSSMMMLGLAGGAAGLLFFLR